MAALSAALLSACETTTQYTSGQDYLARYENAPKANTLNNNSHIDAGISQASGTTTFYPPNKLLA